MADVVLRIFKGGCAFVAGLAARFGSAAVMCFGFGSTRLTAVASCLMDLLFTLIARSRGFKQLAPGHSHARFLRGPSLNCYTKHV